MEKRKILLVDTSLRDGLQAPGVFLDYRNRYKIAESLANSGIDEIEAAIPATGEKEIQFLKDISNFPVKITAWCRALEKDIKAASESGVESVHISFPVSALHLSLIHKKASWALEQIRELTDMAFEYFSSVSIGAQDATRADTAFLDDFIATAEEAGCWKVRIADTVGISTPIEIFRLISRYNGSRTTIEFHAHNDLGMATANSVTAVAAGADAVSATLCGVGERAGNAAIEEIAAALKLVPEYSFDAQMRELSETARTFAALTGETIHPRKAIIGERVFDHQSGIHCAGQIKDPLSFQPFRAEEVGHSPERMLAGPGSGKNLIKFFLKKNKLPSSNETALHILDEVKKISLREKRLISETEIKEIYTNIHAH